MSKSVVAAAIACAIGVAVTLAATKTHEFVRPIVVPAVDESPLHVHLQGNPHGVSQDAPQP
jgi:hypothetical protein